MLLAIYLNDHLAGATAGRELARRAASSNRDSEHARFLADLAEQVNQDRDSLLAVMHELDVGIDRAKLLGGWALERLGRLKLNGRLLGYSSLSRVIELEGLTLGVRGKLALWHTLDQIRPAEPRLHRAELQELIGRAEAQLSELGKHRLRAVQEAFIR